MSTKARPILFKDEMVRAILDGRKTQTRRVMKPQPEGGIDFTPFAPFGVVNGKGNPLICRHGQPGDLLWVRETWADAGYDDGICICYRADKERKDVTSNHAATFGRLKYSNWAPDLESGTEGQWKPSIHMPRWASRITLEITNVRVERLQDVSEGDAKAEGAKSVDPVTGRECVLDRAMGSYRLHFQSIWQSINGPESWEANPWVWVIEFKRIPQEAGQ